MSTAPQKRYQVTGWQKIAVAFDVRASSPEEARDKVWENWRGWYDIDEMPDDWAGTKDDLTVDAEYWE